MKKLILLCLAFFTGAAYAAAPQPGPEQADGLFDKGRYAQARPLYEEIAKTASGEQKLRALYRAVECRALAFEYAAAAEAALNLPKARGAWQGRLLLLKADTLRAYLAQYGGDLPQDAEAGTADVTRRTRAQWEADIDAAYAELWPLKTALTALPLSEEGYYVVINKADLRVTPTLWDFAVSRYADWLFEKKESSAEKLADPSIFATPEFKGAFSKDNASRAERAAALYEDAARSAGNYRDAAGLWKIKRLHIPFDRPDAVHGSGVNDDLRRQAIKTLDGWAADNSWGILARAEALYRSALMSRELGRLETAVTSCRTLERGFGETEAEKKCARLRAEIEMPSLSLVSSVVPPPAAAALRVESRNIDTVYFRVYQTSRSELETLYAKENERRYNPTYRFTLSDEMLLAFLSRKPRFSWEKKIQYPARYASQSTEITPPALGKGLYVAVAASDSRFRAETDLIYGALLNVTDLVLVGAEGIKGLPSDYVVDPATYNSARVREADVFHFYALNGVTGKPAAKAAITAHAGKKQVRLAADQLGMAALNQPVQVRPRGNMYLDVYPYAEHEGSLAYWQSGLSFGFTPEGTLGLYTETDRPVYRPGQTVQFKITALERVPQGLRVYTGRNKVTVAIRDANWNTVKTVSLQPNGWGAVSGSFEIPEKALLGQYHISASLGDYGQNESSDHNFSVEEYKRPEFEVKLEAPAAALRYGSSVTVTGSAEYYFGGGVPNAPVEYTVTRRVMIPWWHWLFGGFGGAGEEVAAGKVSAGADGKFSLSFTPLPQRSDSDFPSTFIIKASARDSSGRTITAETRVTAGARAYEFDIARDEGFMYAAGGVIKVSLKNLNGTPVGGRGTVKFFRIDQRPAYAPAPGAWGNMPQSPSLDSLFSQVANGPETLRRDVEFQAAKPAEINFNPGAPGVYRMTVSAADPWGGTSECSVIILCVGKDGASELNLPAITLARKATVYEGETAELLIGASVLKEVPLFVETWAGQYLLKREMLGRGGLRVYRVKTGADHKGGLTVRWFAAKDFRFYGGQAGVAVPWREKNLTVKFDYSKSNRPGEKVTWSVSAADWRGRPVTAQASVRVFDRSLEYYEAEQPAWFAGLYPERRYAGSSALSVFTPYTADLPVKKGWIELLMAAFRTRVNEPVEPYIKLRGSRYAHSRGRFMAKGMGMVEMDGMAETAGNAAIMEDKAESFAPQTLSAPAMKSKGDMALSAREGKIGGGGAAQPALQPRTNFAETAYFNPFVDIVSGQGRFSFTMPERLTSWKLGALVLTKDVRTGVAGAQAVTAKPVMARVLVPRFWREGDRSEIRLTVTNTTGAPVTGTAVLKITDGLKNVAARYAQGLAEQSGTVQPGESKTFAWPVRVPLGITTLKVAGSFSAGTLSDAEEQTLPVLPGYDRVIRSVVKLLDRKKETLSIGNLPKDALLETAFVQVDPQLASSIMNSLPQLVLYPHECTEQVLNRALPLAVTGKMYARMPELREAVAKVPKRKTISPAWERDNPLRAVNLEETPWLRTASGGESPYPLTDLLNPALVDKEYAQALEKLKNYQRADGSFPWFPGGEGNLYMTLYVLESFATARIYGVELPQDMLRRAMGYAVRELPKQMKAETASLAFLLYGAYTLTSYPDSWPETKTARRLAAGWMELVDKHADALTQLGEAHAAWIYLRLDDKKKSDEYLDRAVDGAKTTPEGMVCWTPEKTAWFWYSDSLEAHAFLLRTLVNLRPQSPLIRGMVLWMLTDRKTTEWKSTKAAAAAVYSMLEYMQKTGQLSGVTKYKVNWGSVKAEASVSAQDFLQKPLRWGLLGSQIKRENATAEVSKDGPGLAFATLNMVYTTRSEVEASKGGLLEVTRRYFRRAKTGSSYTLMPLTDGETVKVGDMLEVHLTINAGHQFEFVQVSDPKGAGFEFETLTSGWEWDKLARYAEPRDSRMNYFASWLPHGEYVLTYRLRPTTPGKYHIGPATLQSMYAPEFAANSGGLNLTVAE